MSACRLYGGPYDGDTGEMDPPLPPSLWAYPCPDPDCNVRNRIHWSTCPEGAGGEPSEEYKLGPHTGLEQLYVWADLELDPNNEARERDLVPAGGELVPA